MGLKFQDVELCWLGHSAILIKSADIVIYIDPYKLPEIVDDRADYVFITHSHYDHCSIEDIKKIIKPKTKIICPADVQSKLRHVGENIEVILAEPDSSADFEDVKFWAVRAYNTNKDAHTREEDWVGYIIQVGETSIYHAGDTDFIPEMKKIKCDVAFLPVGGTFTMNGGEAAKAAAIIKPKLAVPIHYGTIVGEKKDAEVFVKLASAEGIDARIFEKEKI